MDDHQRPQPKSEGPADPAEGVRIIDADEAAEVIERGEVAARRSDDELRYGDRPPPPPEGPRPALRFPLDASSDPTRIERPPVQPAPDPVTGPVELPHWTEPPTGEVPAVLIGSNEPLLDDGDDDLDAWSSFATTSPRWRDADDDWGDDGFVEHLATDDDVRVGALGNQDGEPSHEEYFGFDDLDQRVQERTAEAVTAEADPPLTGPRFEVADDDDWSASGQGEVDVIGRPASGTEDDRDVEIDGADLTVDADGAGLAVDDQDPQGDDDEDDLWIDDGWEAAAEDHEVDPDGETVDAGATALGASDHDEDDAIDEDDTIDEDDERADGRGRGAREGDDPDEHDTPMGRDVRQAVLVGGGIGLIAIACLFAGPRYVTVLVAAVMAACAVEYFGVLRRVGWEAATLLGVGAVVALPFAVYWRGPVAFGLMGFLTVGAVFAWYLVGAGGSDPRVLEGSGATLLGVGWIGGLGAAGTAMLALPDGRALFVIAVAATVAYDVVGFFLGRAIGHRPLSAASPNKTVEGLLGGMGAALLVTLALVGGVTLGPWTGAGAALLLGIGVAVAAPLGDLCQSLLKRDLGVKDMGTWLPGHGGVLDRFDAMLFVLPTVYWLAVFVGHVG